ncbi:MAG: hypothetical protein ACK5C0_01030 [Candidatus Kapaibacterium sp.]|jgi:urease accessory protein UreF|nr:hypothetical protein [Candidatus Kapabacteria bacterium]
MIHLETYIAGTTVKDYTGYQYFLPNAINDTWIWDDPVITLLLEKAAIKLGECHLL